MGIVANYQCNVCRKPVSAGIAVPVQHRLENGDIITDRLAMHRDCAEKMNAVLTELLTAIHAKDARTIGEEKGEAREADA